ncbi:HPP family protein [Psychromonas sp. 14N.309.X.WAT.B.A12]|jgi:CBS domain-containing membrane protein|uniref:HPP family protein n=1 Tax=unclassified Psychromonas TaxID=2614957 RepID=UPI0025B1C93A|nr:HPP family protein [Psychromonas sp. 14N.309.X.WAT.B.A12]MDN2662680.1 HPP family protein [Psychromonas sp. 14N.309.X.WAT.B.A12]
MIQAIIRFLGVQSNVVNSEKTVATIGGMLAIFCCFYATVYITGDAGSVAILPSMGASAVLLFAVPHGQLSTPWAFLGGNILSAIIGVTCATFIDPMLIAAPVAVGLSILVMHLTRSLHPPGGATALAAVIGGPTIHGLGYWYVLTPTLINCSILFIIAMIFNNLFHWRNYPQSFMRYQSVGYHPDTRRIKKQHIHQAIKRSDLVIDASDEQIKRVVDLADAIYHEELIKQFVLELGAFYTNSKPGRQWSVRQVIDQREHQDPSRYLVIYRIADGDRKGSTESCTLQEFAEWANEKMRPKS